MNELIKVLDKNLTYLNHEILEDTIYRLQPERVLYILLVKRNLQKFIHTIPKLFKICLYKIKKLSLF